MAPRDSCFCNFSGAVDIPTKSSANANPDTVSSLTLTPCLAAFDCYYQVVNIYLEIGWVTAYIPVQLLAKYQRTSMFPRPA